MSDVHDYRRKSLRVETLAELLIGRQERYRKLLLGFADVGAEAYILDDVMQLIEHWDAEYVKSGYIDSIDGKESVYVLQKLRNASFALFHHARTAYESVFEGCDCELITNAEIEFREARLFSVGG